MNYTATCTNKHSISAHLDDLEMEVEAAAAAAGGGAAAAAAGADSDHDAQRLVPQAAAAMCRQGRLPKRR